MEVIMKIDILKLEELPQFLTVPETAAFFRIGRNTLYDQVKKGHIPHRKIGKIIRIPKTYLEETCA